MKKITILALLTILTFSCSKEKKELYFLNKNAYQYPVWEEMLLQDKVKFSDVVLAFKAYKSNNFLDEETLEHFEKLEKRLKYNLDSDGYYISQLKKYNDLQSFRKATKNPKTQITQLNKLSSATNVSFGIANSNSLGNWKNLGPFGNPDVKWSATGNGALDHVEIHPTKPEEMYVSTRNGGLWKTTNYGKNWTPITDYFATNNTSCLEISKQNTSIFYLGAKQDAKIWYSTDAGNSWEDRSSGISGTIYDLHSDPANASRVLAATTNGVFLTTDAGLNWSQQLTGSYLDIRLTDNWDLIVVANNNNDVDPVLSFSTNKGDTFSQYPITTNFTKVDKFYMGIHKPTTGATQVFAYGIKNSNTPTKFIGLWKSDFNPSPSDGISFFNFTEVKHPTYAYPNGPVPLIEASNADGFTPLASDEYGGVNPHSNSYYIGDFYVSPNNPNYLLTCREKLWGTEDGGVTWNFKPSYGGSNWADNRYFTTNVAKDSIFWCNDGGLWAMKETDMFPDPADVLASGLSKSAYMNSKVVSKNGDISVAESSQMDVSLTNKGVFITGGQDLGQMFTRNGRTTHVASADVYRGRIKPTDDSKFIPGKLLVNLNGETDVFIVYDNIEADHFNKDRIYGFTDRNDTQGTNDVRLVRSPAGKDGWLVNNFFGENKANPAGGRWTATHNNWEIVNIASTGITDLKPGTFEQSKAKPELAFLADEVGGKVFYTENLSAATPTWVELINVPTATKYRIATHPLNEDLLVIATDIGVFVSKDKGQTFKIRGNFPENNPKGVLIDKTTSEGIYVYTDLTVYYIDENFTEWQEFNKALPLQNLTDMRIAYYPNNDNRLYVSKYGRGVWSTSLYSVLKNNTNKPVADFDFYGLSKKDFVVGDSLQLMDLSLNAENLQWTIENGTDVKNISNEKSPKAKLLNSGFYKVSLLATNANGDNTTIKENFINVLEAPITLNCTPTNSALLPWYKYISKINVNTDEFTNTLKDNYVNIDKLFKLKKAVNSSIYIKDNYSPGYNFNIKVWIDYNNDGDFDDTDEEIATSGGKVEDFTANFVVPNTAVTGKILNMRVVGLDSTTAPIPCQESGSRQVLDFQVIIQSNITQNSSHSLLSGNSVQLNNTYTNSATVLEAGFVYSTLNTDLNIDNSHVFRVSSSLSNNDSYSATVVDLDYNKKYYYRSFVRDISGVFYSDIQSFQLAPFKMPALESESALNLGSNKWMLKGTVFPKENLLEELKIEYGVTDFSNEISFDASSYPTDKSFNLETEITINPANNYQYRLKAVKNGKTYYSNLKTFSNTTNYCTPVTKENYFYRRIKNVTFNGQSNNSNENIAYEDFSSTIFKVDGGETYPISITDSYTPGYNMSYAVYIDLDNNGSFDSYSEIVAQGTPNADTFTGNITIPTENIVFNTNLRMRVVVHTGVASPCSILTGQFEDYSIYISKNIWTGATSTDWDTASNWSEATVPTTITNVLIPSNVVHNPIATGTINVKNLTIETNAQLTVLGAVNNSGSIEIESGASFIAKESVSGSVKYTRFLPAKDKWYLISPPLKNVDVQTFHNNNVLAKGSSTNIGVGSYNDANAGWNYFTTSSSGTLTTGKGYSIRLAGPGKVTFEGNMVVEDITEIPVSTNFDGYTLIGNPYPSYIPANIDANSSFNILKMNAADNAYLQEATIWLWDQSLNGGNGAYMALNHASSSRFIAPGQAFFVKSNGNHLFKFSEDMQSHQNTDVFNKTNNNRFEIDLNMSSGKANSKTSIYYIDGSTKGFDNGFDSTIFESENTNLKVYTELVSDNQGQKLEIQSLPTENYESMVIPLGVKGVSNQNISFTAVAKNIPTGLNVILEDRQTNTFTSLENDSDSYTISLTENEVKNRFYLHVNSYKTLSVDEINANAVKIFASNNTISVLGLYTENSNLQVYNTLGKKVFEQSFKGIGNNNIQTQNLSAGIYIVKITDKNLKKTISKKLFIK